MGLTNSFSGIGADGFQFSDTRARPNSAANGVGRLLDQPGHTINDHNGKPEPERFTDFPSNETWNFTDGQSPRTNIFQNIKHIEPFWQMGCRPTVCVICGAISPNHNLSNFREYQQTILRGRHIAPSNARFVGRLAGTRIYHIHKVAHLQAHH